MNSKEIFEKIESSVTKALNKDDGIILGRKKIKIFAHYQHDIKQGKVFRPIYDHLDVHVIQSGHSKEMWYVDIYNASYKSAAAQYCVEELRKTFGKSVLVSHNNEFGIKNAFQIAITFDEGQIMD